MAVISVKRLLIPAGYLCDSFSASCLVPRRPFLSYDGARGVVG